MRIGRLSEDAASVLRQEPVTCPVVLPSRAPDGYTPIAWAGTLRGTSLETAASDLLAWRMHARSGLRVLASDVPMLEGSVVVLRLGLGPISFSAPCRVLAPAGEPACSASASGSPRGRTESGWARFVRPRPAEQRARWRLAGCSRPHAWGAWRRRRSAPLPGDRPGARPRTVPHLIPDGRL